VSAILPLGGMVIGITGVFGVLIGSFLNVVIFRVPAKKSLIPASRCPSCNAHIAPWQNIPIVSWLLLRGRCGSCRAHISARYPLVEAGTGIAFALVAAWWLHFAPLWQGGAVAAWILLVAYLYLAAISIALTMIDIDTFRLPNAIVLPSIAVLVLCFGAATLAGADPGHLLRAVFAGVAVTLFYGLFWFFWPGGLGFGDVKLAAVLGLSLGWLGWGAVAVGSFAAFACGGAFGIAMILVGKATRRSRIPFGPWMLLGAWIGIAWGESLMNWYLSTFLA